MSTLRVAFRNSSGASAAEFALVLPLFLIFLLGTFDLGRYGWAYNQAEKATQIGARWAVVTDPLAPQLNANYVGVVVNGTTLTAGDRIPEEALGTVECTSGGCKCTGACPDGLDANRMPYGDPQTDSFDNLSLRMQEIFVDIEDANIVVEYRGSGIGYAGTPPPGMSIAPLVTIRLEDMDFEPMFLGAALNITFPIPSASYTLTMEDGQGSDSN